MLHNPGALIAVKTGACTSRKLLPRGDFHNPIRV